VIVDEKNEKKIVFFPNIQTEAKKTTGLLQNLQILAS